MQFLISDFLPDNFSKYIIRPSFAYVALHYINIFADKKVRKYTDYLMKVTKYLYYYAAEPPLPPTPEDLYETAAPSYEDLDMIREMVQEDLYMEAVDSSAVFIFIHSFFTWLRDLPAMKKFNYKNLTPWVIKSIRRTKCRSHLNLLRTKIFRAEYFKIYVL